MWEQWQRKQERRLESTNLTKALSGMYEKPSANNKVHLMKKLFNMKMTENASITQHLNEFNIITNQLSSVEIDFNDEIRALIVLASLPNNWEAMRIAVSNSTGKEKLKYNDIRDLILAEEIHRRDASEISKSGSALNLEIRGRGNDRNSNWDRSKSKNSNQNRSKSRSGQQVQCWYQRPWWCAAKVVRCSWSLPNGDKESLNGPHTKKKKNPTKEYC